MARFVKLQWIPSAAPGGVSECEIATLQALPIDSADIVCAPRLREPEGYDPGSNVVDRNYVVARERAWQLVQAESEKLVSIGYLRNAGVSLYMLRSAI